MQDSADRGWPVGFSIGAVVFSTASSTFDETLKIADQLIYRVKKSGKNNILYQEQAEDRKDTEQNKINQQKETAAQRLP
ncbi:MAG: hypothetical protein O3C57_00870 [Verrucomicrobia bacterium]|nr:hypothetical protein [Verrucomicrobiota bacterium]